MPGFAMEGSARPEPATAVPILLYHSIADAPPPGEQRWTVTPAAFRAQVALLAACGRHALTVSELAERIHERRPLPPRPVILTFDDGYRDFITTALPILERAHLTSTLYVTTGEVGRSSGSRQMLSWEQIVEARDRGVEIGGHTHGHPELDVVPHKRAAHEVQICKAALEDRLGTPVASFSYPHGYHSESVQRLVREAGYRSAAAVKNALSHPDDDVFALARLTVTADVGQSGLARWLEGHGAPLARRRRTIRTRAWRSVRRARQTCLGSARSRRVER